MEDGIGVKSEEDGGEEKAGTSKRSKIPTRRVVGRVVEIAIIVVMIGIVWGLFSLPTIFFFKAKEGSSMPSSLTCTSDEYTGQFCRHALLSRQQCIPGRENITKIYIQSELLGGLTQTQIEMLLENFQSFLQFEPSPECFEMLVPFLCSYIFAPCSDTGQLHFPSEQECVSLRDSVCMQEWQEITNLQQGLMFLPNCGTLPGPSLSSLCQNLQATTASTMTENITNGPTSQSPSQSSVLNITCSIDFYLDTDAGYCKPACGQWKPYPDDVVVANEVIVIVSSTVGIIYGVLIVTISIMKYRHMFKFPAIFIIYQTINITLFLLVVLIGYMDTQTFLCPSPDTTQSITESTPYCTLFGISLHYLLNQAAFFWAAHIVAILLFTAFPFKIKHLESSGHFKTIHVLVLVTALLLPIVCIAVPLGTGGFRPFYYPDTCVAKNTDVSYYVLVLPLSILSAIGVSALVLLFWVLIRRKWRDILTALTRKCIKKQGKGKSTRENPSILIMPTTAIIKVFVSFLCYTTITILGIASAASAYQVQSQYAEELTEYFICESSGISPERVCEKSYEAIHNPISTSVAILFTGIVFPSVNFLYVINLEELHLAIKRKILNISTSNSTSTTLARDFSES